MSLLTRSRSLARGIGRGISYRYHRRRGTGMQPSFLMIELTRRCNSRCAMCRIWQAPPVREMSCSEILTAFRNPLFNGVRWLNITGGEPFLRDDFVEATAGLAAGLPNLELIAVSSNGLLPERTLDMTMRALEATASSSVRFSVSVSVDGPRDVHERMRGVPGSFDRAMRTVESLAGIDDGRFSVGTSTVLTKDNIDSAPALFDFLKLRTQHVSMFPPLVGTYYQITEEGSFFDSGHLRRLAEFISQKMSGELNSYYYDRVTDMLTSGFSRGRPYPCLFGFRSAVVMADGLLRLCHLLPDDFSLGSVIEDDPTRLWFSREANEKRRAMRRHPLCRTCTNECDIIANAHDEVLDLLAYFAVRPTRIVKLLKNLREKEYARRILR